MRVNFNEYAPDLVKRLIDFSAATRERTLSPALLDLVNIRASQLNGCAFCLDMHVKEAKIRGERELRLHHLSIWRESPLFSDKEKACLAWTDAVTRLEGREVSDAVDQSVRRQLSEKELTDLTFAIGVINFFNRINVSFLTVPGSMDKFLGLDKAGL